MTVDVNKQSVINKNVSFRDVLVVKSKKAGATHADIRKELLTKVNPKVFNTVKIRNSKENGALVIESNDIKKLEEVRNNIAANDFDLRKPRQQLPRLLVYDIFNDGDFDDDKLRSMIIEQNSIDDKHKNFCFKMVHKSKPSNKAINIVIEIDPLSYQRIIRSDRLYVGLRSCKFKEVFNVVRCYKCNQYGHMSSKCPNGDICEICAANHSTKDCKSDSVCCINCIEKNKSLKSDAKFDVHHKANDLCCIPYAAVKDAIAKKTSYAVT